MNGILVIDKPAKITSRDAVNQLQRTLGKGIKLGHTGTLDPLATGVLVVCLGNATRLADYVQAMGKSYEATITLGATSTTDDAEGEIRPRSKVSIPSIELVQSTLNKFLGTIQQQPPAYSALKVKGVRAHTLARQGAEVPVAPRPVQIYAITLVRYSYPEIQLNIDCGKGTYIRSLARDLGEFLGCGGYIQALRRTAVGPFVVSQGIEPTADHRLIISRLRPMLAAVPELPRVTISADERIKLNRGLRIPGPQIGRVALLSSAGDLVCIAEGNGSELQPVLVFTNK